MANEYLYGAYGHIGETVAQSAVQAGTTPASQTPASSMSPSSSAT